VPSLSTALKAGRWERVPGAEVADVTVGVVGLGAVGRRTAALFGALGAQVVAYDPYASAPSVPVESFDKLLAAADVISLHCPPQPDGRPVIGAPQVSRMRRGAVLVNTARSSLVDDDAVLGGLEDGTVGAYAVDAFDTEPPEPSALLRHPNTIATPHLGGYTSASVSRATAMAVGNLLSALEGR
jgi:D-3-phosphoglycerate dehydrogenase